MSRAVAPGTAAMAFRASIEALNALTGLENSASTASPAVLNTLPSWRATASPTTFMQAATRVTVPSSSDSMAGVEPTKSATMIAASRRCMSSLRGEHNCITMPHSLPAGISAKPERRRRNLGGNADGAAGPEASELLGQNVGTGHQGNASSASDVVRQIPALPDIRPIQRVSFVCTVRSIGRVPLSEKPLMKGVTKLTPVASTAKQTGDASQPESGGRSHQSRTGEPSHQVTTSDEGEAHAPR